MVLRKLLDSAKNIITNFPLKTAKIVIRESALFAKVKINP